jgi:hypothetical protein
MSHAMGRGRGVLRAAVQVAGFAAGLGLLAYCASVALAPENREHLSRLRGVTAAPAAALVGLTLLSLAINATVFWLAIRPVQRLGYAASLGVNAVATLLSLAPFKLSILFRVVFHRVRDGLPLLTGGAWMGAAGVIILAGLAPPAAASLWRRGAGGGVDALWWGATLGGLVAGGAAIVAAARLLLHPAPWARLERLAAALPAPSLHQRLLPRGHEALRMLADPAAVAGGLALRGADLAVHTARFLVAAAAIRVDLPAEDAVLIASVYFLIGAAAPTGAVGFREGGALGAVIGLRGGEAPYLLVIGLVSAVDVAVVLAAAGVSAACLRLDRLLTARRRRPREAA